MSWKDNMKLITILLEGKGDSLAEAHCLGTTALNNIEWEKKMFKSASSGRKEYKAECYFVNSSREALKCLGWCGWNCKPRVSKCFDCVSNTLSLGHYRMPAGSPKVSVMRAVASSKAFSASLRHCPQELRKACWQLQNHFKTKITACSFPEGNRSEASHFTLCEGHADNKN